MLLKNINPFIRFADAVEYSLSRGFTRTYDCRCIYILSGSGRITLGQTEYPISENMLITFQPGTLYKLEPLPKFCAIAIDYDFTQDYCGQTGVFPPMSDDSFCPDAMHTPLTFEDYTVFNAPLILQNAIFLRKSISELTEEYNSKHLLCAEASSLLLKKAFFEIVRHESADDHKNKLCTAALNYIYANYNKPISNTEVAAQLHLDPRYLSKLVKSCIGQTLHKHLVDYRIGIAAKLLLTTNMSIEEIAYDTGFYNLAHFSAAFKKKTGNPPSYYRRGK